MLENMRGNKSSMKENSKIELSIIVPVYNAETFLYQCIDSILNQTFQNFELILVNDGSTDGTEKLCADFAKKDERVIVINQRNQGIGEARNTGLRRASGTYIGFVDSDDNIHPFMYEYMLEVAVKKGADIVMCNVHRSNNYEQEEINTSNIKMVQVSKDEMYTGLFSTSETDWVYMAVWNKIYKREIIEGINFIAYGSEDAVFNMQVCKRSQVIFYVEEKFYTWIQRQGSETHKPFQLRDCQALKSYYDMNEYIKIHINSYHHLVLCKLYKVILNTRYRSRNTKWKREVENLIKKNQKMVQHELYCNKEIKIYIKIIYSILFYVPWSYSLFRYYCERREIRKK